MCLLDRLICECFWKLYKCVKCIFDTIPIQLKIICICSASKKKKYRFSLLYFLFLIMCKLALNSTFAAAVALVAFVLSFKIWRRLQPLSMWKTGAYALRTQTKTINRQKNAKNVPLWFLKELSSTTSSKALTEGGWTPPSIVEDDESSTKGICRPFRLPSTFLSKALKPRQKSKHAFCRNLCPTHC